MILKMAEYLISGELIVWFQARLVYRQNCMHKVKLILLVIRFVFLLLIIRLILKIESGRLINTAVPSLPDFTKFT